MKEERWIEAPVLEKISSGLESMGIKKLQERPNAPDVFPFVESPISREGAELLKSPLALYSLFENRGIMHVEPISVSGFTKTTLLAVAAIQRMEPVMQEGLEYTDVAQFVAQPVIRTQFADSIREGVSTSFINIATEQVVAGVEKHLDLAREWISVLEQLGIKKVNLGFFMTQSKEKWGKRSFECDVAKIYLSNLEIGDAVYIDNMPQDNRLPLHLSDIGFGLERLSWVLRGGRYLEEGDAKLIDAVRTTTLLAMSNVAPANNNQGYRFRMFSKRVLKNLGTCDPKQLFYKSYEYWLPWVKNPLDLESVIQLLAVEFNRNLKKDILDELKNQYKYNDVDVDISNNYDAFLGALRGTSIRDEDLKRCRERLEKFTIEI